MANIIAIVGRPNVGKSTLFNKLIGERRSIMDNESGVTRDRHYGISEWNGKRFTVIDTGGYVTGSDDVFEKEIREQVELAVEEANVIIFVLDAQTGLTGYDEEFAKLLRRSKKPVLITANKIDVPAHHINATEFYALGMGEVYAISADNGSGTGELLDEVTRLLPENANIEDDNTPKIAIIGKPNVGKSSFSNLLLGYKRSIVTDIAGTTRDAVYAKYKAFGYEFNLIDTAGLRRKAKVKEDLEFYSVLRTVQAVENADICVVMMDATLGY
jgi:GTPase